MSNAKQCPSTRGSAPATKPAAPATTSAATGKRFWRGLDELVESPEFIERLQREFPAFASELQRESRRTFMKIMGASFALAGLAGVTGCRRPDHKILAYANSPEEIVPGNPTFYASALPKPGGGAFGVLAETHTGRPTKLEGNPLHPGSLGKSTVQTQASILDLYDPDRFTGPSQRANDEHEPRSWADFERFASQHFQRFDETGGEGLYFLVDKQSSPSRDALKQRMLDRWRNARWISYEAIDPDGPREGSRIAFGDVRAERRSFEDAQVVLSVDCDFLGSESFGGSLEAARGFAAGRRVPDPASPMNRLYTIEARMSLTGGAADHRMRVDQSSIGAVFAEIAQATLEKLGSRGGATGPLRQALESYAGATQSVGANPEWVAAVSDDLIEHAGECLVVVGAEQPAAVHALGHALNAALSNVGRTIEYVATPEDVAASSRDGIRELRDAIDVGSVNTLVIMGPNVAYSAPADYDMATRLGRVNTTIHLGLYLDETGAACDWHLSAAHPLETWSDVVSHDGSLSVVQPMIRPLAYETGGGEPGRGALETLALIMGDETQDSYEIVRRTWRSAPANGSAYDGAAWRRAFGAAAGNEDAFEKAWRRILHNGVAGGDVLKRLTSSADMNRIAQSVSDIEPAADRGVEALFVACPKLHDGRFANNGWLQELPDPVSKMTWDNPVMISPAHAEELGVSDGDMMQVGVGGRTLELPVWRVPGLADRTVIVTLGYGRTRGGRVLDGVGFNTYELRGSETMETAQGVELQRVDGSHLLATTQTHWAMEGRPIVLEFDVQAWRKHGGEEYIHKDSYGNKTELSFAERHPAEILPHAPVTKSLYKSIITEDQEHTYTESPQWGMSIDLTTCTGCSACTIACQAENNIPIVGKREVSKGREMHWIRVDRYFGSDEQTDLGESMQDFGSAGPYTGGRRMGDVDMVVQPVACVHCENAPCETVCPVNATVHDEEGLNVMAYNRCIGTRYCSNNCPYKVRRFNYFDYATKRYPGDYVGKETFGGVVSNEHFIPPRLREKIDEGAGEIQTMQYNPDVTVRERGVMEKCTYCIQRLNGARVESKLKGLDRIPDGMVQTACQQACPSDAIQFGDILDPDSRIHQAREHGRSYGLLAYLNTAPRTTFMARLRNPNPRLRTPNEDPFHHGDHHGDHNGHNGHGGHGDDHHDDGHVLSLPVLSSISGVMA